MGEIRVSNTKLQCEAIENYKRLLELGFTPPFRLELGPGRGGSIPDTVCIGLNPSADPGCQVYFDLNGGIPLPDESVLYCHSNQVLEHITREKFIEFMNDLFRVMIPGGKTMHCVPHWQSPYAWGDPTHYNVFTEATFQYFCQDAHGNPFIESFSDYGVRCNFILEKQDVRPAVDITVWLVKPGGPSEKS